MANRHGNVVEVDIHGMTSEQARRELEKFLTRLSGGVTEVAVIHGYNGGKVLRDMVRNQLKHPRIASKLLTLNEGQTRILLKPKP